MNSLERVIATMKHEPVDRIPVYPLINSVSYKSIGIDYEEWSKDYKKCAESIIKTTKELGVDVVCNLVDLSVEAADWGQELLYFPDKAACPNHHNRLIKSEEEYDKIKYIDYKAVNGRMAEHVKLTKLLYDELGQEKPIVGFVLGPLAILSMMRGQSEMFIDCFDDPDMLRPALEGITETLIEFCDGLLDAGAHGIMFDTLFASASIMSPTMWDDLEGDLIERLTDHVRARGGLVMLHNCGTGIYFKEQIARMKPCLISFLHVPFDCKDYADTREKYGKDIVLAGCLEPGTVLTCTNEELREKCKENIDMLSGEGYGYMLATGCEYPAPLDFEKAKIMIEVANTYGKRGL